MEPQRTPYDLNFQVAGTPVRIHPLFWLISAALGWAWMERGFPYVLVWVGCVFVSVLIHELGHIWMGQAFGTRGHVIIYGFGGLAVGSNALHSWWKRVVVAFAGPLAGFIFLAALLAGLFLADRNRFVNYAEGIAGLFYIPLDLDYLGVPDRRPFPPLLSAAVYNLVWINLFWGLINLLPVWPLDGGQISRDVCSRLNRRNGLHISLGISLLVAGLIAVHCIMVEVRPPGLLPFLPPVGGRYTALLFGLLAVQSFMQLQQRHVYDPYDPWLGHRRPWEREDDDWKR